MYSAGGWVAHHNTDLWRATAPIDGPQWGMWPTGGAWLAHRLWERYVFTGDRAYPATHLSAAEGRRPVLPRHARRGADAPVARHLTRRSRPRTASVRHVAGDGPDDGQADPARPVRSATKAAARSASIAICRRAGRPRARGSRRSDRQRRPAPGMARRLGHAGARAAPSARVASLRTVSRRREIDVRRHAGAGRGRKRSLEMRGDEATGWATAWRINLWARLGDGDHAHEILKFLLAPSGPIRTCSMPTRRSRSTATSAARRASPRCCCRATRARSGCCPRCPSAWPSGHVTGLRARGGFEVDLSWKDRAVERVTVRSLRGGSLRLRRRDTLRTVGTTAPGAVLVFESENLRRVPR